MSTVKVALTGRTASWLKNVAGVPLLGKVTAGKPILAVEEVEEYVHIPGGGYHPGDLFALRVCGDSMIKAGIYDKDIVIVRKTPTADNGDIVVALIGDEATVKRIYREKDHIRLQPENDAYETHLGKRSYCFGTSDFPAALFFITDWAECPSLSD